MFHSASPRLKGLWGLLLLSHLLSILPSLLLSFLLLLPFQHQSHRDFLQEELLFSPLLLDNHCKISLSRVYLINSSCNEASENHTLSSTFHNLDRSFKIKFVYRRICISRWTKHSDELRSYTFDIPCNNSLEVY